jgi:hypothetical protein
MSILEQGAKVNRQTETDAIVALDSIRWNRKRTAGILKIPYKSRDRGLTNIDLLSPTRSSQ